MNLFPTVSADPSTGADVTILRPGGQPPPAGALVVRGTGTPASGLARRLAEAGITPARVEPFSGRLHAVAPTPGGPDLLGYCPDLTGTVDAVLTGGTPVLLDDQGRAVGAIGVTPDGTRLAVVTADLADGAELERALIAWAAPARAIAPPPDPTDLGPAWADLAEAIGDLQPLQHQDGSVDPLDREAAAALVRRAAEAVGRLAPQFPHDAAYLAAVQADLHRWADEGVGIPDFLDSLVAFTPAAQRVDGLRHLVVFPMYTQNGSRDRHLEAVVVEVRWPQVVAELEAGAYSNPLFVPIRFVAFTAGYATNSAVLFPETVAMRAIPTFTWGAIFADREAARFRRVVRAATELTGLALPPEAARLLEDQELAEETFIVWDLIHDRTHMRGDLPFDPFMIKQRMPYFLYALEELRCDLTAFRAAVALEADGLPHARLVQYAIVFDRIFRFPITGARVRNYDGLGGQLLFAWLHQHRALHWTDNRLSIEWHRVAGAVLELAGQIDDLYWRSIDRPKIAHWLAAYELVAGTLTAHPASVWAKGPDALALTGPLGGLTDALLDDEFPLSMFYEALARKLGDVVASTAGITGREQVVATR